MLFIRVTSRVILASIFGLLDFSFAKLFKIMSRKNQIAHRFTVSSLFMWFLLFNCSIYGLMVKVSMDQRGVVKFSLNFLSIFLNFNLIINDQLGCKIDDSWKYALLHKNPVIRGLLQNKKYKNDWLADRLTLHFCLILILSILLRLLLSTSFDFNFIIVQTLYPQLFAGCFICEIFWASGFTACCCMINQKA